MTVYSLSMKKKKKYNSLFAANVSSYSHYIFSAIAQEDAEVITFEVNISN